MHHVIEWAHGVANLNDPFYVPTHSEYFNELKHVRKEERDKRKIVLTRQRRKRKVDYERTLAAAEHRNRETPSEGSSASSEAGKVENGLEEGGNIPRNNIPELLESYATATELIEIPMRESEKEDKREMTDWRTRMTYPRDEITKIDSQTDRFECNLSIEDVMVRI